MCAVVPRYLLHMRSPLPADEMIFSSNQSDVDCRWVPLPPPADGLLQEGCPGIIGWCCLSQGVILLASCVFFSSVIDRVHVETQVMRWRVLESLHWNAE